MPWVPHGRRRARLQVAAAARAKRPAEAGPPLPPGGETRVSRRGRHREAGSQEGPGASGEQGDGRHAEVSPRRDGKAGAQGAGARPRAARQWAGRSEEPVCSERVRAAGGGPAKGEGRTVPWRRTHGIGGARRSVRAKQLQRGTGGRVSTDSDDGRARQTAPTQSSRRTSGRVRGPDPRPGKQQTNPGVRRQGGSAARGGDGPQQPPEQEGAPRAQLPLTQAMQEERAERASAAAMGSECRGPTPEGGGRSGSRH